MRRRRRRLGAFFDRAGAAAGLLDRPAPGCRIVDGELGGLPTREFHPARTKAGRTVLYLHGGGFLMYPRSLYTGFLSRLVDNPVGKIILNHGRSMGMDMSHVVVAKYDGVGRADRIGLNFTEVGTGVRASVTMYDSAPSSIFQGGG